MTSRIPGRRPRNHACSTAAATSASAGPAPARIMTCRSPAASSSPSFTCGQLPHGLLAALYGVHRSTVTRAVREIRPLLAARGFAVPEGQRLKTMADVFAYAAAPGITLRMDGTEVRVRRPKAKKPGRRAFDSGKKKMNAKKATVFTGEAGRTLFAGAFRPGRMHDQTAVKTEGIADLLTRFPQVKLLVDAGYRGLAKGLPGPGRGPAEETGEGRHRRGDRRLRGTAAQAVLGTDLRRARQRRPQETAAPAALPRKPDDFDETFQAIAGLVSDRAAAR
ncbi:MAG TPA: transposase family protein [Streptosporangiaceae bacterium]|nr:transposase family protein [Streptosporangiaceae bacterium]